MLNYRSCSRDLSKTVSGKTGAIQSGIVQMNRASSKIDRMRGFSFSIVLSKHSLLTARRIAKREVQSRVVGTVLGFAHYFIAPLFYLSIYTWLFSSVFVTNWGGRIGHYGDFALRVYAGLIVFQFFSDVVIRAPRLLLENPSYVTKIAFPLEILVLAAILTSLFVAVMNYTIFFTGFIFLSGFPPPSAIGLLLVWPALVLFIAGWAWFLAALGVYLRDLSQLISTVVPALMFVSPIFYPVAAVPQNLQIILLLNPLAWFVEATRGALIDGVMPGSATLVLLYGSGIICALFGLWVFQRTKHGFADVV